MADTSFRFGTDSDDNQLSPDEADCLEIEEEEYDALNDETFGGLEDSSGIDDWEQQHEQFAELAENCKQSDGLDISIDKLNLDESSYVFPTAKDSVWSYNATQNGDIFSSSLLSNLEKSNSLVDKNHSKNKRSDDSFSLFSKSTKFESSPTVGMGNHVHKICTVEELERGLLQNRTKIDAQSLSPIVPSAPPLQHLPPKGHTFIQHPIPGRLPPGLHPPMGMRPMRPIPPHIHIPPGLGRLLPPPHFMQGAPTPPPGLIYSQHQHFPVNHPFNFPAPPRIANMHHNNRLNHHNHQHRKLNDDLRYRYCVVGLLGHQQIQIGRFQN